MIFLSFFFFFNDTATTEIYTLSLHDALPICHGISADDLRDALGPRVVHAPGEPAHIRDGVDLLLRVDALRRPGNRDRKSTRLNSSHANISYAVFCLKKKNHI